MWKRDREQRVSDIEKVRPFRKALIFFYWMRKHFYTAPTFFLPLYIWLFNYLAAVSSHIRNRTFSLSLLLLFSRFLCVYLLAFCIFKNSLCGRKRVWRNLFFFLFFVRCFSFTLHSKNYVTTEHCRNHWIWWQIEWDAANSYLRANIFGNVAARINDADTQWTATITVTPINIFNLWRH